MRRTTWFGLTVIVGALAFAPAPALASLDVFFESHRYAGGTTDGSYIGARNIQGTSGPGSCNPNGMFDCDFGPPTTLSVERGGQIVASNTNGSGKPGVTIVPQAGDVVH